MIVQKNGCYGKEQNHNIVICITSMLVRWLKILTTFNLPWSVMATVIIKTDTLFKDDLVGLVKYMTTGKSMETC